MRLGRHPGADLSGRWPGKDGVMTWLVVLGWRHEPVSGETAREWAARGDGAAVDVKSRRLKTVGQPYAGNRPYGLKEMGNQDRTTAPAPLTTNDRTAPWRPADTRGTAAIGGADNGRARSR